MSDEVKKEFILGPVANTNNTAQGLGLVGEKEEEKGNKQKQASNAKKISKKKFPVQKDTLSC